VIFSRRRLDVVDVADVADVEERGIGASVSTTCGLAAINEILFLVSSTSI